MRVTVFIDIKPKTGIAICTCSGIFKLGDAQNGAKLLWNKSGWLGKAAVWDFTKAQFEFSTSDVKKLAKFIQIHQPSLPPSKMAFVADDDYIFGLSRMFEAHRHDQQTQIMVFKNIETAINWITDK